MQKTISECQCCSSNISPYSPIRKIIANSTKGHSRTNSIDLILNSSNTEEDGMQKELPLGPLDPLNVAMQRIKELEFELAEAKLRKVEAECRNQVRFFILCMRSLSNNSFA